MRPAERHALCLAVTLAVLCGPTLLYLTRRAAPTLTLNLSHPTQLPSLASAPVSKEAADAAMVAMATVAAELSERGGSQWALHMQQVCSHSPQR